MNFQVITVIRKTESVVLESALCEGLTLEKEKQDFWRHRLPPTPKIQSHRIILTFRKIRK